MNVSKKRGRSRSRTPAKKPFKKRTAVPAVLQLRRPEKHSVDTVISQRFNNTGNFILLNACIPGDNVQNRTGRKISMASIALRGYVHFSQTGTTPATSDYLRLILFYDRQPNGAAPAYADMLQSVDQGAATTTNSLSNLNISNADRFKVLMDKFWAPQGTTGAATGYAYDGLQNNVENVVKEFIPLKGMETHFNAGTAGTVADITTGSLYLLVAGLRADADAQWIFDGQARLRYFDQ